MHPNEPRVKEAAMFPKGNKQRDDVLEGLRKDGYFIHNQKVMETGEGVLIVERRSSIHNFEPKYYRPCYGCRGWYHKDTLRKHADKCIGEGKFDKIASSDMYNALFAKEIQDTFQPVLQSMTKDEVTETVKQDTTILQHGQEIYERHNFKKPHLASTPMRRLAKLVNQIRIDTKKSSTTLVDLIQPENFDKIVNGVRSLCKFNSEKKESIPSMAMKLGHAIKSCAGR